MTKTPDQIEFAEIVDRLKTAGLNQSDITRELNLKARGYIGMVIKGDRKPSPRTMSDLRKLDERVKSGLSDEARPSAMDEFYERMVLLEKTDKSKFDIAVRMLGTLLPADYKRKKRFNSGHGGNVSGAGNQASELDAILYGSDDVPPKSPPPPRATDPTRGHGQATSHGNKP